MAKKTNAGSLFYTVAFDKRVQTDDGFGNTVANWQEQFQARAAYRHLRGGEAVIASRLQGKHIQVVTVRAYTATKAVTTDFRVRDARTGQTFNIRDVTPHLDRQFIDFLIESGVADG
ncbi:phage head closure protein [Phyllobacterium lublinensis]|uniref:phage head closure protein n=1 Tax=Phyllobacterium lublinensis TaxID=2875708 RepID=UPI001CCE71B7|nr:phage head closure protein [Phyllobacterium sp. 2063]MBZ9653543.1 phage head closure protein [Phyllobacterium sp. 2063]